MSQQKKHKISWKSFHRWGGVVLAIFVVIFCVSGIILNHREFFADCSVSRSLLPDSYSIRNFNNGIVKGTCPVAGDSNVILYGNGGMWLCDRGLRQALDFNNGLPKGADYRNIKNIVRTRDGHYIAAAQYSLYRLDGDRWTELSLPGNTERLSDVALAPDSTGLLVVTRSSLYKADSASSAFRRIDLAAAEGYEFRPTLFKTVWMLHSGELFGFAGRVIVDFIAAIIAFLTITGLIVFVMARTGRYHPHSHRHSAVLRWNWRKHVRIGFLSVVLTILLAATGMCLRPPLMIPLVLTKTSPLPGSALDSENPWHDKLRAARWDSTSNGWLISTSEGFVSADSSFSSTPVFITTAPPVSPMGINVFEEETPGTWLVGSFSGMYRWNPSAETIEDYTTGETYNPGRRSRSFTAGTLTTGFSKDLSGAPVMFDYSKGADLPGPMPVELQNQPMSLWNVALELHTGRCYTPFLGPVSDLFVFIAGLLIVLILVSGLIVHLRHKKKKISNNNIN